MRPLTGLLARRRALLGEAATARYLARLTAVRAFLRVFVRAPLGPPVPLRWQRRWLKLTAGANRPTRRARHDRLRLGAVEVERTLGAESAAVLYLHGGGGALGEPSVFRASLASLAAAAQATIFAPDYRKAPEHPCPAALDDALACYRALLEMGWTAERVAIGGDSIGGGVAIALALAIAEARLPPPASIAVISPHVDMTLAGESMRTMERLDCVLRRGFLDANVRAYTRKVGATDHRCSPLLAGLRGLPPLLIQSGEADMLFSDSTRLAERAGEAGVQVTLDARGGGLFHAFQWFPRLLPEAEAALADVGAFLKRHWSAP